MFHVRKSNVRQLRLISYLAWFPGAKFKRQAKEWAKSALALKNRPFDELKVSIVRS